MVRSEVVELVSKATRLEAVCGLCVKCKNPRIFLRFLQEQLHVAVVARTEKLRVFQAIGGDDAAAKAAADRQEALAVMRDAAEPLCARTHVRGAFALVD